MNLGKKTISCFVICPAKNGLERFDWIDEYTKEFMPETVKNGAKCLGKLYKDDKDFNKYGYLIVPVDIFHRQIIDMLNNNYLHYFNDEFFIYRFDNKMQIYYNQYFLPCEAIETFRFFGINK
jgi:hypothetical protein